MTDSSVPVVTGGGTNGPSPNLSEHEETWKDLLKRAKGIDTLSDYDRRRLEEDLDSNTCEACIKDLKKKYEGRRDSKFLKAIEPAVKGLKAFSDGVNTLSKHPTGLSIAWGITQLVLEVSFVHIASLTFLRLTFLKSAEHSYTILTQIASLIERFAKHLPRYKDYAKMLSEYPRLYKAMAEIYVAYLEMCLHSIAYLKRSPWGMVTSRHMS
jgi:hypothetical protein